LLDTADFDGAALLSNDPYRGATIAGGTITLSAAPGLGASPVTTEKMTAAFQSA
jgi:hypothetical protein